MPAILTVSLVCGSALLLGCEAATQVADAGGGDVTAANAEDARGTDAFDVAPDSMADARGDARDDALLDAAVDAAPDTPT